MALKITKAADPIVVNQITMTVYAVPGIGKSTLGFTAEAPLLLDFDQGSYRAGNRGDVVQVQSWDDVSTIGAADLGGYKTLIVDTAGRALDALTATIIRENPKLGRGGALTLQGYGELKSRFVSWTKLVRSFGLDVVLISHSEEKASGDDLIERLDMQGASKNEIYKCSDVMGRLHLQGGKRMLNFNPTDTAFGKNPTQLAPIVVPHFADAPNFLGTVIASVKEGLNSLSEDQKQVAAMLVDWKASIDDAKTADEFNALIPKTQEADERVRDNVKRMLVQAAKAKGLAMDKSKTFKAAA